MKRTVLLVCLVMLITSVFIPVSLAENTCPNHPRAGTYWGYTGTEYYSPIHHRSNVKVLRCRQCDRKLSEDYSMDYHRFSNGYCSACGYKRPTKSELTAHAWMHISDIGYRNCYILYASPVYSSPNGAGRNQNVTEFEEYRVIGSREAGNMLWLEIAQPLTTTGIGWIPAEVAYVQDGEVHTQTENWVIGRTCRILVSSGRARLTPGDGAVIEVVKKDQTYKILDVAIGSDGKEWYKIKKDNNQCWISAGIVKVQ